MHFYASAGFCQRPPGDFFPGSGPSPSDPGPLRPLPEKPGGGAGMCHLAREQIRRTTPAGKAFWSSREFAVILGYGDYRNFEGVVEKAKLACFNSGHRIEDHFADVTEMIEIGKGGQRPVKTVFLSRYGCYLAIQNADPKKEIVAHGQTYFAICSPPSARATRPMTSSLWVVYEKRLS